MKYHDEYTRLNSYSHRKPPAKFGAPGLCRQFNLWIPDDDPELAADQPDRSPHPAPLAFRARRIAWVTNIDRFIANLFTRICFLDRDFEERLETRTFNLYNTDQLYFFAHTYVKLAGRWALRSIFPPIAAATAADPKGQDPEKKYNPDFDLTTDQMPARFQVVSFRFFWESIPVRLQFSLHNEYLEVGIYLDLVNAAHDGKSALRDEINHHFLQLNEICETRYTAITNSSQDTWTAHALKDVEKLLPTHEFLYNKIWEKFENDIFENDIGDRRRHAPGVFSFQNVPRYLENRIGSIFYDTRGILLHCPTRHKGVFQNTEDKRPFCSPPFHAAPRQPLANHLALNEVFDDVEAVNYTDSLLPFLGSNTAKPHLGIEYDERIEYTASRFLRNRVIYVSCLAAEHTGATSSTEPSKFLILCRPFHRWQLGRLVERILALGSVRVAAHRNLDVLNDAGDALRELTRRTQQLLETPRSRTSWKEFDRDVATLRRGTARIGLACDGGLEYRIERSRYYVQQYRDIEDTLEIKIVEGFQKDDIFARRRFFSTFDFIDRLGTRMGRHKRDLELLGQQVQMWQTQLLERTNKNIQKGILRALVITEALLILPLTYYGGNVWKDTFGGDIFRWLFLIFLGIFGILGCKHWIELRTIRREEAEEEPDQSDSDVSN